MYYNLCLHRRFFLQQWDVVFVTFRFCLDSWMNNGKEHSNCTSDDLNPNDLTKPCRLFIRELEFIKERCLKKSRSEYICQKYLYQNIICSDQTTGSWDREHFQKVSQCTLPHKILACRPQILIPEIDYYWKMLELCFLFYHLVNWISRRFRKFRS